jgi:hypothetical protein
MASFRPSMNIITGAWGKEGPRKIYISLQQSRAKEYVKNIWFLDSIRCELHIERE